MSKMQLLGPHLTPKGQESAYLTNSQRDPKYQYHTIDVHSLDHCSVAQSCLTLCDPVDCSMPSFPVLYHLQLGHLF